MHRIFTSLVLAAFSFTFIGCTAMPGDRTALIVGIGFVRVQPPGDGARFEMIGVAAVVHPAFTGVAAGAVAHQSVAVGLD